jgi:Flp pilus assembly protein TadD
MELLVVSYNEQGRHDEAEVIQREVLESSRRVLGEEHQKTLERTDALTAVLRAQGRLEEAEELLRETLEISRGVLGEGHETTHSIRHNLACQAALRGSGEEAVAILREALDQGYRPSKARMLDDPDLASLHGDAEFEAIVEELRRRDEEHEETSQSE